MSKPIRGNKRGIRTILKSNTLGGAGETAGYEDDEENRGLMYPSDGSEGNKKKRNRDFYEGNQNGKRNKSAHKETKRKP